MSDKLLLIDQSYGIETRVATVKGATLENFDCELSSMKLKKGNVYLARIARIEPSLQAVFVDYGEEKQGFLPFSEIHPSYYQGDFRASKKNPQNGTSKENEALLEEKSQETLGQETPGENDSSLDHGPENSPLSTSSSEKPEEEDTLLDKGQDLGISETAASMDEAFQEKAVISPVKIQAALKRGQILMVQVVKDVRGSKGAALTTYISLPGKYSVFMPNTPKGMGISRKITSSQERESLRDIVQTLKIQEGSSLIIRTAGLGRTKIEIRKDYEYLTRLWSDIAIKQHSAKAPCLLYEESDLLIRALRDYYSSEISEILIDGEEAYKKARAFMRMFMPSHARRVHLWEDVSETLFQKFGIEGQLESIHDSVVSLPSGGSIVINQTEALVAIDVNSSRATKERSIDETALKTNLEAAAEIARQLQLRDLSGLIVIDFIDMPQSRHIRVERALKDALAFDRARLQVGHISSFGLLEMSRQRLRQSLLESSSSVCPHCSGSGRVLSLLALSLNCLRTLEKAVVDGKGVIKATGSSIIVNYLLNHCRHILVDIEKKKGATILLDSDLSLKFEDFYVLSNESSSVVAETLGDKSKEKKQNPPNRQPQVVSLKEASEKKKNLPVVEKPLASSLGKDVLKAPTPVGEEMPPQTVAVAERSHKKRRGKKRPGSDRKILEGSEKNGKGAISHSPGKTQGVLEQNKNPIPADQISESVEKVQTQSTLSSPDSNSNSDKILSEGSKKITEEKSSHGSHDKGKQSPKKPQKVQRLVIKKDLSSADMIQKSSPLLPLAISESDIKTVSVLTEKKTPSSPKKRRRNKSSEFRGVKKEADSSVKKEVVDEKGVTPKEGPSEPAFPKVLKDALETSGPKESAIQKPLQNRREFFEKSGNDSQVLPMELAKSVPLEEKTSNKSHKILKKYSRPSDRPSEKSESASSMPGISEEKDSQNSKNTKQEEASKKKEPEVKGNIQMTERDVQVSQGTESLSYEMPLQSEATSLVKNGARWKKRSVYGRKPVGNTADIVKKNVAPNADPQKEKSFSLNGVDSVPSAEDAGPSEKDFTAPKPTFHRGMDRAGEGRLSPFRRRRFFPQEKKG